MVRDVNETLVLLYNTAAAAAAHNNNTVDSRRINRAPAVEPLPLQ
jgi:hypothetical protein